MPLRLVVDPGVYISAAISGRGPNKQLVDAAVHGRVILLMSPTLLAELRTVLRRPKFRRWLTLDDVADFVDALVGIAELVDDPPTSGRDPVCRDPKDEYLVALVEGEQATLLVSGDRDLLDLERGGVIVRNARETLEALEYEHPWSPDLVPGRDNEAWLQTVAEGHGQVFGLACGFLAVVRDPAVVDLLPAVVTPESLTNWLEALDSVRALVAESAIASRAEYPTPDVAYVKLFPDPGDTIRATGDLLLEGGIILTLQRRPELPDIAGTGGWRVHAVGDYESIENMPVPPVDT